ncbi:MAG TPA: CdaR family protein [Candidatus Baltobacteraceae bacterium]|nr:CdaR family protein [Candidatus Baltobacteraceae bacterium]
MQIVRRNFGLKLLAVTLAIVGWAYVRFAANPIVAAPHFDQQMSVPIATMNLQVGYVAHFTERDAVVTVQTGRGAAPIKPDEIKAVLDLSNKGVGVYNVPVQLVAPDVAVQSLSPASVTLTIEKIEQRSFPIVVHYVGTQRPDIVVRGQQLQPSSVTIQGPTSVLAQVAAVHVDVSLPTAPTAVDEMLRPMAVNALGEEIAGLQVAPDLVRAQFQFLAGKGSSPKP